MTWGASSVNVSLEEKKMFSIALPADRTMPDMGAVATAFGIGITDLEDAIRIGTISR